MLRHVAHAEAIKRLAEQMIEAGILERSEEETAPHMGDFARELTGKPVHIEFAARDGEPELPPSCQPEIPSGWSFDKASYTWSHHN